MSKRKNGISEALNDLMGEVSTIPEERVNGNPQQSGGKKRERMSQHNFRMRQAEWERLKDHFQNKGISLAGGVRMVLLEYMRREKLIK